MRAVVLTAVVLMIFTAGCSTEFKPEHRTLGLTPHEFNQRFMANMNALAASIGVDTQATTMNLYTKEPNPIDNQEKLTYQLGDEMFMIEIVNTDKKELKEIKIICLNTSAAWSALAEAAYVASIKAVNPQFKSEDFSKLHDELFSNDEFNTIFYQNLNYTRHVSSSGIDYRITAETNYFAE